MGTVAAVVAVAAANVGRVDSGGGGRRGQQRRHRAGRGQYCVARAQTLKLACSQQ
jgi:hypothetical protein